MPVAVRVDAHTHRRALPRYLTAAAHGDADGSFFYAHALDFGVAGARDHALARAWYEKVRIHVLSCSVTNAGHVFWLNVQPESGSLNVQQDSKIGLNVQRPTMMCDVQHCTRAR
jgi:TPR repeat protein